MFDHIFTFITSTAKRVVNVVLDAVDTVFDIFTKGLMVLKDGADTVGTCVAWLFGWAGKTVKSIIRTIVSFVLLFLAIMGLGALFALIPVVGKVLFVVLLLGALWKLIGITGEEPEPVQAKPVATPKHFHDNLQSETLRNFVGV
jgi:hypothetical protein